VDSIASIVESVVGEVFSAILRTASDSIAFISESVSRSIIVTRLVADVVGPISEAVTRVGTFLRTATDSIPSLSEVAVAVLRLIHALAGAISVRTLAVALTVREFTAAIRASALVAAVTTTARRMVATISISAIAANIEVNGEAVTTLLVEGDTAPLINGTITDAVTGAPINLTDCDVYFQLRLVGDRRYLVNGACTILSPTAGTVSYDLADNDLDFDGVCQAQFLVVFADQTRQTTAVPIDVTVRSR
jgi:hypothetical protein